jgi:hypothetical protein
MFTDVLPMVIDVYPMVAEESSVANPQKVAKIDEISEKCKQIGWQHCICRGITRFLGIIGIHRCHR